MKKYFILFLLIFLILPLFASGKKDDPDPVTASFGLRGLTTSFKLNDEHCGYLPEGCSAKIKGDWISLKFGTGTFSADLNMAWQNSTSNGLKGYCAPVTGSAVIKSNENDKINIDITGNVCDLAFSSEVLPHIYRCTFTITGGTGEFKDATGSGTLRGSDPLGIFRARGEITY